MNYTARLHPKRLTDGSLVYDVSIEDVWFTCVSEDDAGKFLHGMTALIRAHTNEDIAVRLAPVSN